jgi:hypothetical protein
MSFLRMKVIGLPGRTPETKEWIQQLLTAAGFPEADIAHYSHWERQHEGEVDLPRWNSLVTQEAERLQGQSDCLVVAKSFGTLVAALAFELTSFRPSAAIFIGTPLRSLSSDQLQLYGNVANHVPLLFIQQSLDPGGSYAELHAKVRTFSHAGAAEVPGSDHLYSDISKLVDVIRPWLAKAMPVLD